MNIQDLIRQRAIAAGVDPDAAIAIAKIESGFDPASNKDAATKYKGLYQLGPDEWSKYGKGDIYDPTANADAFLGLYKNNTDQLAKSLGRQPTAAESYLAHQQGIAGASALLTNPNQNAVDTIAQYYPNRKIAMSAITGNGGDANGTAADFVNVWNNKYGNAIGTGPAASYQETGAPTPAGTKPPTPAGTKPPSVWGLMQDPKFQQSFSGLASLLSPPPEQTAQLPAPYMHRPEMYGNQLFAGLLG